MALGGFVFVSGSGADADSGSSFGFVPYFVELY
jgi:hypothetical protein